MKRMAKKWVKDGILQRSLFFPCSDSNEKGFRLTGIVSLTPRCTQYG